MHRRVYVLDARLFALSVFLILVAGRAVALLVPLDFYFTFQSLFSDRSSHSIVVSLLGKMVAPAACGLLLGVVLYSRAVRRAPGGLATAGLARKLRHVWAPSVLAAGFFASFVSAWPNIAYWDLVSNPAVASLKTVFFLMYLLYMVAYGYVALLGLLAAIYWRERVAGVPEGPQLVGLNELGRVGALWVLNSGIASSVMKYISQ